MSQTTKLQHRVKKLKEPRRETHKSRIKIRNVNVHCLFTRLVDRKPRRYMRELSNTASQQLTFKEYTVFGKV